MNRLSTFSRSLIVASTAAGVLFGLTAFAAASPPDRTPVSGDDRATAHPGNVVAADCSSLFPGSTAVAQSDIDFTGGDNTGGVDITAVPDGVTVVGVVVKGGPAYNVYSDLGDLPWTGLHAPLVPSGKPAAVSHWFVCGTGKSETSTPTETPTDTPTESPTSTAPEGQGSGGGAATATSTSEDVASAADEEELAETGFEAGPLVALGAMLLLGGAALVLVRRGRGARR
jgi:LPXTG-motif cell wall-anchored protein